MKSCTMRISSMHGHLDLVGDTTGETESGTLSEHTDFEVIRRRNANSRRDITQMRGRAARREDTSAEGFERN